MPPTFDPEIAAALAAMAQSGFDSPPVGAIEGRRAMWEPIIGASGTAQPIITTSEHHATAEDGAEIPLRWYTRDGSTRGSAVLFCHGGGYIFGPHRPVRRPGLPRIAGPRRITPAGIRGRQRAVLGVHWSRSTAPS
jgi:acetyl esterase/lipase